MGDDDDWSFHVDLSWVIKEREESGIQFLERKNERWIPREYVPRNWKGKIPTCKVLEPHLETVAMGPTVLSSQKEF